jgi:undecaprenyl-diphosphatase
LKILAAFFITGIGGLLIKKAGWELPKNPAPIAIALLVGGILFVVVEFFLRGKVQRHYVGWDIVLVVGLGQILAAIFPGTSRSGATILLSLILGLSRPLATEFSFIVSIPTMMAASGLELLHALRHHEVGAPRENWGLLLLAAVIAAVVSFLAVKWLLRYVQTHTFTAFGWYRIALGAMILLLGLR